jgi:diketogulonate reductase-like aldo/keto reductase
MMEKRKLGSVEVPVIGLGTWDMEKGDLNDVTRAIHRALDLGMTHIDTAEMYGSGKVEEIVGRAIEGRRDEVFLTTKVLPSNASYEGTIKACERSLKRLRTDVLDLYLLHWLESIPFEETFRAFEKLRRDGRIRFYGVSNFNAEEMERAEAIAGRGQIACNQVLYHLGERRIEHELLPWCREHGVPIVGYSPFASGHFDSSVRKGISVLDTIAKKHSATARQVALRFLTREPFLFTIPKAARVSHVEEIAKTSELHLTPKDLVELERAFPVGKRIVGVPML